MTKRKNLNLILICLVLAFISILLITGFTFAKFITNSTHNTSPTVATFIADVDYNDYKITAVKNDLNSISKNGESTSSINVGYYSFSLKNYANNNFSQTAYNYTIKIEILNNALGLNSNSLSYFKKVGNTVTEMENATATTGNLAGYSSNGIWYFTSTEAVACTQFVTLYFSLKFDMTNASAGNNYSNAFRISMTTEQVQPA